MELSRGNSRHYRLVCIAWFIVPSVLLGDFASASAQQMMAPPAETRSVIAAIPKNQPPRYFTDSEQRPAGFAIEFLEQIAALSGLQVTYHIENDWPGALAAVQDGRADILPSCLMTEQTQVLFDFTTPVETIPVSAFIAHPANASDGILNFSDRIVGVAAGGLGSLAMEQRSAREIIEYPNLRHLIHGLIAGNIDVLVHEMPVTHMFLMDHGLEDQVQITGEPLVEFKRGVAVKKGNRGLLDRLQHAQNQFMSSNDYSTLYIRWFGEPPTFWTSTRVTLLAAGVLLCTMLIAGTIRYFGIRKFNRELLVAAKHRREAETRLQEHEHFLQQILDTEPGIVYIYDLVERRNVFINKHWRTVCGYTPEETEALGDALFTKFFHPDDLKRIEAHHADWRNNGDEIREIEYRLQTKTGDWRWMYSREDVFERDETGLVRRILGIAHDITDVKAAQDAVQHSRELLLLAQTIAHIGNWEQDLNTGLLTWSDEVYKIFGISRDDFTCTADAFFSRVHPDDVARVKQSVAEAQRPGATYNIDHRILRPDGEIRHVTERGMVFHGADGRIERLVGTIQDITERVHAEQKLQAQEFLLSEMSRMARIGGWSFNPVTGEGTWTAETARIHDLDPETVTGAEVGVSFFHGETRRRIETALQRLISTGQPYDLELEMISATGVHKWVRTIGQPVLQDGSVIQVRGTFQDITTRKLAEEKLTIQHQKLSHVLEVGGFAHWDLDVKTGRLELSPLLDAIYGLPLSHITDTADVRQRILNLVHPDDRHVFDDVIERTMRDGDITYEYRIVRPDGEERILMSIAQARYDQGTPVSIFGLVQDVTERRRQVQERITAIRAAERAYRMASLGTLSAGIAHDFNNILSVILANAQFIQAAALPETTMHNDAAVIVESATRAADLVRKLLAFSRKDAQFPRVMNVGEYLRDSAKMLKRLVREDIEFNCVPPEQDVCVLMDPSQMDQIVMNLTTNAVDAMPVGGRLNISAALVKVNPGEIPELLCESPAAYAVITLADTGTGIPESVLHHIFEPFFTTKDVGKGTGLGLSSVYGIVERNDGCIRVESEVGKGTVFHIYLPAAEHERMERPAVPDLAGQHDGTMVLVVEDDDALRRTAQRILEHLGYAVRCASNGNEALQVFQKHSEAITVVLTDVIMPGMRGTELAEHLTALKPDLPVVFMSGYGEEITPLADTPHTGRTFIQKPFNESQLAAALMNIQHNT